MNKQRLLQLLRSGKNLSIRQRIVLVALLSIPTILAQLSTILMQYIDSAMVGHLGANQSASIGLVSTSTWILGGFCMATSSGFTVQVAQNIGANNFVRARQILREALTSIVAFSIFIALIGASISSFLPQWLGGNAEICSDATSYFLITSLFVPTMALYFSGGAMLQASGNMKIPAILDTLMCVLDVCFNYLFIYTLDMGVAGAAWGTGLAELVTAVLMMYFLLKKSPELALNKESGSFIPQKETIQKAFGITGPLWVQNVILRGAHIVSTIIIAPLGPFAIAANSFAITAECLCYMPGYGLADAATTLVGQSIGANRRNVARDFALMITTIGAGIMSFLAILMYIFAPQMMQLLTNVPEVIDLGTQCLRIEAFAETLYAVSIVADGACVGAGDTTIPTVINLSSMWGVRIVLALILTPILGLKGYWIAMMLDLNIRGIFFFIRIFGEKWMKKQFVEQR